jgi:hypothetical protein
MTVGRSFSEWTATSALLSNLLLDSTYKYCSTHFVNTPIVGI